MFYLSNNKYANIRSIMDIGNKIKCLFFSKFELYVSVLCELILSVKSVKQLETVLATLKILETRLPPVCYEMASTIHVCFHV